MKLSSSAAAQPAKSLQPDFNTLTRDEKILKYLPLVRAIASRVREGLPVHVDLDDIVHAGVLGLFDAVDKFKPDKNVVFHLYAKHRIRGAILDSLRQLDWASRDLRKRYKSFDAAAQQKAQKLGRAPTEDEVASELGVDAEHFRRQKSELHTAGLSAIQHQKIEQPEHPGFVEPTEDAKLQPDLHYAGRELRGALDTALAELPPRYQKVVRLYYDREQTMKQIGAELGVNESRVSQIHKAALQKLAVAMRGNGYAGAEVFLEESD